MIRNIKKFFSRKNKWITITFTRNSDLRWFARLTWWPFKKDYLEMVSGSADFLDFLQEEYTPVKNRIITLSFLISNKKLDISNTYECARISRKLFKGAFYKVSNFNSKLFLCPVTLFVLGCYPKYIYINKNNIFIRGYNKLR